MSDVIIQVGLPDCWRDDAARLYYEAFRQKAHFLFGSRERAIVLLQSDCAAEQALIAVQDDRLVGLAGIQHGRPFVDLHFKTYVRVFGWVTALWRYVLLLGFHRSARHGELVMNGIAVDATVRGQGVGSKLLHAVVDLARTHGYSTVRLDVVDTNVRARQLYERLGFVAIRTHRLPLKREWLGFTAVTTMIKSLS